MRKFINLFFVALCLTFTSNIASAQQKIAHLNSETIFASMPEAKTATAALEALQQTKKAEIDKMQGEYSAKYTAAAAKEKTINEANKEAVNKELQVISNELAGMKNNIDQAVQKAQQDMAAKQGELMTPLQTKFIIAVKAVSKEKHIAYVFDTFSQQGPSNIAYWEGGDDITAAVQAKLGTTAASVAPAAAKKKP